VTQSGRGSFPADPFWDFSVDLYGRPGVADACLFLQDQYGLNVNLTLLCVWCGARGPGKLTADQVEAAMNRTRDWQSAVVRPLRTIRKDCRTQPLGIPEFLLQKFQPLVQALEIEAEHVEQLVLAAAIRDSTVSDPVDDRSEQAGLQAAIGNLLIYLALCEVPPDESARNCLQAIVSAIFPAADTEEYLRSLA
jgi:uncharacterized protein (TIGR02444 family)